MNAESLLMGPSPLLRSGLIALMVGLLGNLLGAIFEVHSLIIFITCIFVSLYINWYTNFLKVGNKKEET